MQPCLSGKETVRMMRRTPISLLILGSLTIAHGCSGASNFPDPYQGYAHSRPEHGYWREIPDGGRGEGDPKLIRELHFHDRGFSVTYQPFEAYKDYWGTYEWNASDGTITLSIGEGNTKPAAFDGVGKARLVNEQLLELSEVALADEDRSKTYRFRRFDPRK
jgi:hypothetical protein